MMQKLLCFREKLKLHSCCCEEQQQWHTELIAVDLLEAWAQKASVLRAWFLWARCHSLQGHRSCCRSAFASSSCKCFGGEDQKSPSSHFDGSQGLHCVHKASGGEGWEGGMTKYFSFIFHEDCLMEGGGDEWPHTAGGSGLAEPHQTCEERGHAGSSYWGKDKSPAVFTWPVSVQFDGLFCN